MRYESVLMADRIAAGWRSMHARIRGQAAALG
jgi:hypothetical protein